MANPPEGTVRVALPLTLSDVSFSLERTAVGLVDRTRSVTHTIALHRAARTVIGVLMD